MKVAALYLLLLMNSLDPGQAQVSLSVHPKKTQFFKYDSFSLSCKEEQRKEKEEEMTGWSVMKKTVDGEVHHCPSPCSITTAYPFTDSGAYWCESGLGAISSPINISVTAGTVILEGPVHPVIEGDNVTLRCRGKVSEVACDIFNFYKGGRLIQTSTTGNMTVHNVSKSDEGLYKCDICGSQESPQSWLIIKASPADQDPPAPLLSAFTLVRHLVVGSPYLLSTIMLGLVYRDRARGANVAFAKLDSKENENCVRKV